ncbi:retinoblastoma-like protein 2 [Xyrichtys novacula]|uniref:Retinoblastoma-like protein 2 n=1 Tax=Xyrichtys novacula TaxID=13765 RepID=A0AAV1EK98_XYRNO|nr:retinoblastoma-like protein 2 [Xyrichtys novacula]
MAAEPESNHDRPRSGPSERLTSMLRGCSDQDQTERIQTRLRCMLQEFLQHHRDEAENESANELASECCRQAGIWYYMMLEELAIQESERLGTNGILGFLSNERCQRCLIACCLGISISSNNLPYEFLKLLELFSLAPYHFRNVIEPVFRAVKRLPSTSFKYLSQLEDKILESLAWTSASPLWEEIRASGGHFPSNQQVMFRNSHEDPSSTDLQPEGHLPEVSANPDQQPCTSTENGPKRNTSLTVFARKVYLLMDQRLKTQFSTLAISEELQSKIWTCFEHSLVNFADIMVDRHLDQLLMCAIFIIAQVG